MIYMKTKLKEAIQFYIKEKRNKLTFSFLRSLSLQRTSFESGHSRAVISTFKSQYCVSQMMSITKDPDEPNTEICGAC